MNSLSTSKVLALGALDARHQRGRRFGIRFHDLERHVHVLGATGVGKSALLETIALGAINAGMGVALIDPHGDLAERVLDRIPREATSRTVLIEPWRPERPIGWNPLEHVAPDERSRIASGVLGIFHKVFHESWGPRMEHVFRNVLLALLDVEGTTLLGALRMLVDEVYRARIVDRVKDPLVRFYWTREFPGYPKAFLAEVIAPVQNKIAAALTSPYLRAILGQRRSTVTAAEIMGEGRILVANLAKGRVGEDASAMLGATLITSFQTAAYARAAVPEEKRRPFLIVADEFQNFVTRSIAGLLAEGRKYRVALVVAHQHLAQLDAELASALQGNAGTRVAFRLGADDAEVHARDFGPEIEAQDLVRLDRYEVAIRLMVDGLVSRPFTATTLPPSEVGTGRADLLRRLSSERYGRDRTIVEAEVLADLGLSLSRPTSTRRPRGTENLRLDLG